METKNIILYAGEVFSSSVANIREWEKNEGRSFRIAVLYDSRKQKKDNAKIPEGVDIVLQCDLSSNKAIQKTLLPYQDSLLAITVRNEKNIPHLQKIIPHVPYLHTPTSMSLTWATNKTLMRKRLYFHDKTITPAYAIVYDTKKTTLKKIEEGVGFPLVVKPAGLACSLLVSVCFHEEELEKVLRMTFRKIKSIYKNTEGRGEPSVLVEQFMEGEMYSIDAYVDSRGHMSFCPVVHVKTGRSIGFDDFFGYQQTTPTLLSKESIEKARCVTKKGIYALGLRSTTAHVELLKTEKGWKIVEIGPRMGGFRNQMYKKSFGINHAMNDILIRIPEKVVIPKKVLGHSSSFKFFAKKEGILTKLTGIKKAQELKSFYDIDINKKLGDRCLYAKNGGKSVFNITLFNKERSDLLADIRRLEKLIKIETS